MDDWRCKGCQNRIVWDKARVAENDADGDHISGAERCNYSEKDIWFDYQWGFHLDL